MVCPSRINLTEELALFRRETVDGNRVTGVMRGVVEEDLTVTFITKTALVALLESNS
jgi:hypothetical protein